MAPRAAEAARTVLPDQGPDLPGGAAEPPPAAGHRHAGAGAGAGRRLALLSDLEALSACKKWPLQGRAHFLHRAGGCVGIGGRVRGFSGSLGTAGSARAFPRPPWPAGPPRPLDDGPKSTGESYPNFCEKCHHFSQAAKVAPAAGPATWRARRGEGPTAAGRSRCVAPTGPGGAANAPPNSQSRPPGGGGEGPGPLLLLLLPLPRRGCGVAAPGGALHLPPSLPRRPAAASCCCGRSGRS